MQEIEKKLTEQFASRIVTIGENWNGYILDVMIDGKEVQIKLVNGKIISGEIDSLEISDIEIENFSAIDSKYFDAIEKANIIDESKFNSE